MPVVHIDVPMPMGYATMELAKQVQLLEPFGVGNPKPLFAQKEVVFVGAKRIGANGSFARFSVLVDRNGKYRREDLMYFGDLDKFCIFLDEKYKGDIYLYDSERDSFMMALKSLPLLWENFI